MPAAPPRKPNQAPPEGAVVQQLLTTLCRQCRKLNKPMAHMVPQGANEYLCIACSGLGHLVFLPSGDVAMTRRATRHSPESRQLVSWNGRRKRWERRGIYVTADALAAAQAECLLDESKRAVAREKAQVRDARKEATYLREFAEAIRQEFPGMEPGTAEEIASHACEKYSGRVGRAAGAREGLDRDLVTRAVIAHVRHLHTDYDHLRDVGMNKRDSRDLIRSKIRTVLAGWRRSSS